MSQAALQSRVEAADEAEHRVVGSAPRVSIAAFCETPETARSIEAAIRDRRMARAHASVELGGVDAAVRLYQEGTTPNVLIVETHRDGSTLFDDLARLAEVCDPTTKVVIVGHVNDVVLFRELMRQGVSEYIVAPVSPLQIIESIITLFTAADAEPIGRVFAFVGAKGGVGSSTIAHNVGWTLSDMLDEDVIITDLDLAFGTAGLNFNLDPPQGIADALGSPERVDDVLIDRLLAKCGEHLSLLAAPGQIDRDYAIEPNALELVLDVVRHNVPCVIVDVPNVWASWTKQTLLHADDVVVTATPDLASLRNAKNLIDLLRTARPNDRPPKLVLNQLGVPKRPEIPVQEFVKAVGVEQVTTIPYEPQIVAAAANDGRMVVEASPGSKVAEAIRELSRLISGRRVVEKQSWLSLAPLLAKLPHMRKTG